MKKSQKKTIICDVCKRPKKMSELFPLEMVHEPVMTIIQKEHPVYSFASPALCFSRKNLINEILQRHGTAVISHIK